MRNGLAVVSDVTKRSYCSFKCALSVKVPFKGMRVEKIPGLCSVCGRPLSQKAESTLNLTVIEGGKGR